MIYRLFLLVGLGLGLAAPESQAAFKTPSLCTQMVLLAALAVAARVEATSTQRAGIEPIPAVGEAFGHVLGPVTLGVNAYSRAHRDIPALQATMNSLRTDYGFLFGYAAIYVALKMAYFRLTHIDMKDFVKKSEEKMQSRPGRVLVLSSPRNEDVLGDFAKFYFHHEYGSSNHAFRTFRTKGQLKEVLEKLEAEVAADPSLGFERVEVFIHGAPGAVQQGNGSVLTPRRIRRYFGSRRFDVTRPGAQIRFISCSLAGWKKKVGYDLSMLRALSELVLAKGGTAFGAASTVGIDTNDWTEFKKPVYPQPPRRGGEPIEVKWSILFPFGVAPFVMAAMTLSEFVRGGFRLPPDVLQIEVQEMGLPQKEDEH